MDKGESCPCRLVRIEVACPNFILKKTICDVTSTLKAKSMGLFSKTGCLNLFCAKFGLNL